jgi:chromosome segregation ATPase
MEQPELERSTVQNTNDILSIHDLLSGMEATLARHTIQLSNIQHRLETHDAKLEAHDARFDAIDRRFDALDRRFDALDRCFDALGPRIDHLDSNVEEILRRLPG